MKKIFTRKILPALLALILIAGMMPAAASAEDAVTYTKVTEAPSDWSGRYLIVYEGGSLAFDGSLSALDAANDHRAVEIENDFVMLKESEDVFYFEIEPNSSGGYDIKSASGYYIYQTSDANGLKSATTPTGSNVISLDASGSADIVSGGAHLRFNAASNQMRFRYYKSGTYTNQKPIALYRAEESAQGGAVQAGAVQASVASGLVPAGTKVELSCASEGAVIRYRIGDGETLEYSSALTIAENCVIEAWAEGSGYLEGPHTVLEYTVADREYVKALSLEEVLFASSCVIYHPASGTAASSEEYFYSGGNKYELKSAATVSTEKGIASRDACGFTVSSAEGGHYSFAASDGRFLYIDNSGNVGLREGENEFTLFDIESSSGGYLIKSVNAVVSGNQQYLEYYKGYYTSYSLKNGGNAYVFEFYVPALRTVNYSEVTTLEALDTDRPLIIYYGAESVLMSVHEYLFNNKKMELEGTEAALSGGIITLAEDDPDAAVLDVSEDGSGHYTFRSSDGKYLLCDGTNVQFTGEEGEYTLFDLVETDGGFFIKSTNAQYGGKDQYIEYYKGYFTCYSMGMSPGIYTFRLFQPSDGAVPAAPGAPSAEPEAGEVEEGTEVTLTSPGSDSIYAKLDDGDYFLYEGPIAITKDTTITAYAVMGGFASEEASFTYTVKSAGPAGITAQYLAAPADGDILLIYHPDSGRTMGTGTFVYTNSGTGATKNEIVSQDGAVIEAEAITAPGESALLTLTAQGEHFRFVRSDGSCLSLDGNDVEWVEPSEIGETDYTLFDLEEAQGGWYIRSVNASFNGKAQYLEYYGGYFTCYSMNASYAARYTFTFYTTGKDSDLRDGDLVVIYNPASMKALSSAYSGYYNQGVDVSLENGALKGYGETEVWKIGINDDGTFTFETKDGKKLSMGTGYSSMPLDDVNTAWDITEAFTEECVYIRNTGRGLYIEWYAEKNGWSGFGNKDNEPLFAQKIVKVDGYPSPGGGSSGTVVIYNALAEAVFGQPGATGGKFSTAGCTVTDELAYPGNGALVFDMVTYDDGTVTFLCDGKYLTVNEAEELFLSETAGAGTLWKLIPASGGYRIQSTDIKYKGTPVEIEYFAGAFSGWTYKSTDAAQFIFSFYPVAEGTVIKHGIVDAPAVTFDDEPAFIGLDYEVEFTVDSVFEIVTLTLKLGDEEIPFSPDEEGTYKAVIPSDRIMGEKLVFTVTGSDSEGVEITGTAEIEVRDEPVFTLLSPKPNSETGENKRPVISAKLMNGDGCTVQMYLNGEAVNAVYEDGVITYVPEEDLADGTVNVTVTAEKEGKDPVRASWKFTVGDAQFQLYFGQLHSHTTYSDGSGSLETALEYISNLPGSANVQFVAFTDHSNYFDAQGAANPEAALYDMSLATAQSQDLWKSYNDTIDGFNASHDDVIALAGFEMTWSGGPGHVNTFETPGIVSRNNTTLNDKKGDAGLKAYYALLSSPEGALSVSQFNHPGKTFGNFVDFSYWDAVTDSRIYLVEVGNGEGPIGQGGYYPSYEQYIMALDKGWHVAPSNNQDNHKGSWGNANDARDVILTDDFSPEGLFAAIRLYRVYATEDKNLEIYYTLNDEMLGSVIQDVPENVHIEVSVNDPDSSDTITKVEVVVNSGKTAYTWANADALAGGTLSVDLEPSYSYYFIRVTEGDGDIAVTAPVWVGESLKLGISAFESEVAVPVSGEPIPLKTTFFNSEAAEATVKSIIYTTDGSKVIGTDTDGYTIPAGGTLSVGFELTPDKAKIYNITVTAVMELDGEEYTFTKSLEISVLDAESLVYVGIDASHQNEYVNGNYKDNVGNFSELAVEHSVRAVIFNTEEDLIAACASDKYRAIILTVPSRRDGTAIRDPYDCYSQAVVDAINEFNLRGGIVIVTGWSDAYEAFGTIPEDEHMSAQQNMILSAIGSSLRIGDDATRDGTLNGGQPQRLYFSTYNFESFLADGVQYDPANPNNRLYTEVFSQYGGASVYAVDADGEPVSVLPGTVTPVVYAHATTVSQDIDGAGYGGDEMVMYQFAEGDYRILSLATEQLEGRGLIIVSGATFMSNYELQAVVEDTAAEKNYSNYRICENLLDYINPPKVTPIGEVREQKESGYQYTIEGTVTSNASGYDKDTAFFDCIYVQDETGGICCFPVAGEFKIGDVVRITGITDFYQGEAELQVRNIEKISEAEAPAPRAVSASQVNDLSVTGELVTVRGRVKSFEYANGLIQTIILEEANGDTVRIFIDGYITTDSDVEGLKEGAVIQATGLASYDDTFNAPDGPFPRIRIRDRADITCSEPTEYEFIDGTGSVYEKGSSGALIFRANGSVDGFCGIRIDGEYYAKDSGLYTYYEGSTVIVLPSTLLGTLETGRHTITAVYYDGECETYFAVAVPAVVPPKDPVDTGYQTGTLWWAFMAAVCGMMILVIFVRRRTDRMTE